MKRLLFILALIYTTGINAQCLNCPGGITAPGAAAGPSVKFNGYTSEVKYYDGIKPTCYTPTANTLNGHLQGINNRLCYLKTVIDSLKTNDSSAFAQIDSIQNRIDSIVDALGQFYNTSVISSDSSIRINVSTNLLTRVNTFNLSVMNDSVAGNSINGITGTGQSFNPYKLGGTLTENTRLTGNKQFDFFVNNLTATQNDSTQAGALLQIRQFRKYSQNSDFADFVGGISAEKKSVVSNNVYNLSTLETSLPAHYISHSLKLKPSTNLLKTVDSTIIGSGDVENLTLNFEGQQTESGNIVSMRNLTLGAIFKGTNTSPFTNYRYVSLALSDLTQNSNASGKWIIPTDRYAIYQEGPTDKNQFNGLVIMPNLTVYANDAAAAADTALPSGGFYLLTASTVLHVKP